jgi:hypothetical protein
MVASATDAGSSDAVVGLKKEEYLDTEPYNANIDCNVR